MYFGLVRPQSRGCLHSSAAPWKVLLSNKEGGWDMKIRHFARNLVLAAVLILPAAAEAAPAAKETWIGAWGFVPTPLPPGVTPALAAATPEAIPLAVAPAMPAPATPTPPLLDNPGNVPVVAADSDPSNVTIRQLVRVAVAGKRIRLRFSNEGGSDALTLGSVHVAAAGPDGSVVAGSDQTVTYSRIGHSVFQYVAGTAGDHTDAATLPSQRLMRLPALVTEIDVDPVSA